MDTSNFEISYHDKKKIKKLKLVSRAILTKLCIEHHLVLVHLYTNFELNNSKFAQVTQVTENFQ